MNKKLLASLLSFATITSFITATPSNKTELLKYLKQCKTELEDILDMERNFGEPMSKHQFENDNDYNDIENASLEMYHLADEIITPYIETAINALCNREELPDYSTVIIEHLIKEDFINKHKDEITTILDKYSKNDTQAHKNNTI